MFVGQSAGEDSQVCCWVDSQGRQAGYVGLSVSWGRLIHWSINQAGQVGRYVGW